MALTTECRDEKLRAGLGKGIKRRCITLFRCQGQYKRPYGT